MVKVYDCPRVYVSKDNNDDINMKVVDQAKDPNKRASLDIGAIHERLSIAENWVRKDHTNAIGTQNLIAVDLSFEISTGNHGEGHKRKFITFPLKVPSHRLYTTTEMITDLKKELKTKSTTAATTRSYKLMRERYHKGHELLGESYCGCQPKFTGAVGDAQYTAHSEQALMNYLSTKACSTMLANRLVTEIRAKKLANYGDVIKIYAIGLHIHSTKTVCGPCERSLVGLQNSLEREIQRETPQFLEIFQEELEKRSGKSSLELFPSKNLKLFTTYTANKDAKNHTAARVGRSVLLERQQMDSTELHICNYGYELDENYLRKHKPDLNDRTLFASASKENKNTQGSQEGLDEARKKEGRVLRAIRHLFDDLSL